jgi:hypothetical protein
LAKKHLLILFFAGILVAFIASRFQRTTGYMDAEYYYAGGMQLYQGQGLTENYLWNYLDNPAGIPHPAFAYWMPLPSLLAAAGMELFSSSGLDAARALFLLLDGLIPVLVALLAYSFTKKPFHAYIAALLSIFSCFYLIYASIPETFLLSMALGTVFILVAGNLKFRDRSFSLDYLWCAVLGLCAGLLHLNRADGVVWLAAGAALILFYVIKNKIPFATCLVSIFLLVAGYAAVMGFWYFRNWSVYHSLFPPGNSLTLFLVNYDQTFLYPASQLTLGSWLSSGWQAILQVRLDSLVQNLKNLLAVQGEIFLLPLIIVGCWKLRKELRIQVAFIMWSLVFLVMTFVFPFAGARGGFIHSGAAFQPVFWAVTPVGLESLVEIGVKRRHWSRQASFRFFSVGVVLLAVALSAGLFLNRVIGSDSAHPVWDEIEVQYSAISAQMAQDGAASSDIVMIKNPPAWYLAADGPAIVIPDGDAATVLAVANRYGAQYLVLDRDHVSSLDAVYNGTERPDFLKLLFSSGDIQVYKIDTTQQ